MRQRQILIIDDSKAISFLLQTILGKKYQIVIASDGFSAMHWLSRRNQPDLIIVNPQLPDMQNWELVEYLSTSGLYGSIPLIVLSGLGKAETAVKSEEFGVSHFFSKPFNPIELEERIDHLLTYKVRNIQTTASDGARLKAV